MSCSNGFIATFCDDAMLFRKQFLFLAKIQRLDISKSYRIKFCLLYFKRFCGYPIVF